MKRLIRTGKYNSGKRPSQHNIGKDSFKTDNQGAIPPNVIDGDLAPALGTLLKGTNTHNGDQYQLFSRDSDTPSHPARMPPDLVEFFVRFLTEERDLVLDPFGGSNTTGAVSERLGRRWVSCETDWTYASSSISRFDPAEITSTCYGIWKERTTGDASE